MILENFPSFFIKELCLVCFATCCEVKCEYRYGFIGGGGMINCKLEAELRIRIKVTSRIRIRIGDDLLPVRTSVSDPHHMDADP
jgi:hypothetical protein